MGELLLGVIGILLSTVISVIALVSSKSANKKSTIANELAEKANNLYEQANKLAQSSSNKVHMPKIKLIDFSIDPNKIEIFAQKNMQINGAHPMKSPSRKVGTYEYYNFHRLINGNFRNISLLAHPLTMIEYLFLNLCSNNFNDDNKAVVFGMFNVTIDFGSDSISEIKIEKAYAMVNKRTSIGNDLDINVRFFDPISPLKIPIAFVCPYKKIEGLLERVSWLKGTFKSLNLFESKSMIPQYTNLDEFACLLRCKTIEDEETPYYYSLLFHPTELCNYDRLNYWGHSVNYRARICNGSSDFYEMAKRASERADCDVIFESID